MAAVERPETDASTTRLLGGKKKAPTDWNRPQGDLEEDDEGCCGGRCRFLHWQPSYQLTDSDFFKPYTHTTGRYLMTLLRLGFALWCVILVSYSLGAKVQDGTYWLFKMTGWTFIMTGMYFFGAAYYSWKDTTEPELKPTFGRIFVMLLLEIAFAWSPVVMFMYWVFQFPNLDMFSSADYVVVTVHTHAIGFLWLLLDLIWCKIEFFQSHLIILLPLGATYVIANGTWAVVTDPLGWGVHNTNTAIVWTCIFLGMVAGFYLGYFITRINRYARRLVNHNYSHIMLVNEDLEQDNNVRHSSKSADPYSAKPMVVDSAVAVRGARAPPSVIQEENFDDRLNDYAYRPQDTIMEEKYDHEPTETTDSGTAEQEEDEKDDSSSASVWRHSTSRKASDL